METLCLLIHVGTRLKDDEDAICEALRRDLGKSTFESSAGEIEWCKNEILYMCSKLRKWAKDEPPADIPLMHSVLSAKIRKEPLGCVLIIGYEISLLSVPRPTLTFNSPHNVPFQLTLVPLIGAIAAGNAAVIKPSEVSPASSMVIQDILTNYLDPSCYMCVQGAIAETTTLLDLKWNKIFFTGSVKVGKIIAQKASETLTPYTLELGGQNPAIVTKNCNQRLAARRLLWAKIVNAGQICISQNYVLVDECVLVEFLDRLKDTIQEFYPDGARVSPDYCRIVSSVQWNRLKNLLQHSNGKVVLGGTMTEAEKFIEPTVIQINDPNDSLMLEETFGPIITILPFRSLDEAIQIAKVTDGTPLAVYPFGTREETDYILNELQSGGASINDGWIHGIVPTTPFGGIGDSGTGAYRGKASFECFTHRRSVTATPGWGEGLLGFRYPPYKGKLKRFKEMTSLQPKFDADGNLENGITRFARGTWAGGKRLAAMSSYALTTLSKWSIR